MNEQKYYSKEIKEEVVNRIKSEGKSVSEIAKQYGFNPKTIYNWLRSKTFRDTNVLEMGRLKRENDMLLKLIGMLTLEMNKGKKI